MTCLIELGLTTLFYTLQVSFLRPFNPPAAAMTSVTEDVSSNGEQADAAGVPVEIVTLLWVLRCREGRSSVCSERRRVNRRWIRWLNEGVFYGVRCQPTELQNITKQVEYWRM